MTRKITAINVDYLIQEHIAGKRPVSDLAKQFGVSVNTIIRRIESAGVAVLRYRKIDTCNHSAIITAYIGGESCNSISLRLGIGRGTIHKILLRNRIQPRNQSESETLKWTRMDEQTRKKQVSSAHDAVRGMKRTSEDRTKRAQGCFAKQSHIQKREALFADMISSLGVSPIHQFPIGPYNCDLAIHPVAVEIQGYVRDEKFLARQGERTRYILNSGWNVLFVFADRNGLIGNSAANYLVSYLEELRSNKPCSPQYRMIGGAGKLISTGGLDCQDFTIISAFKSALNKARTKHHRVRE